MDLIRKIEAQNKKNEAFVFNVGDTVRVVYKIIEVVMKGCRVLKGLLFLSKTRELAKHF